MLTIEHLSHRYPNGVQALADVSLDIGKGMFGLLGPNGAGKSTLMRTIATLQQPQSGHIRFGGLDVLKEPQLLIVDEPTAGLDPEERNRFYNQLAEVGQDVVVLLSTHIVEDVAVLCSNLAVMADGNVVERGTPEALKGALQGRIWQKIIARHELDDCRQRFEVISHHYSAGRLVVQVLAESCPAPGFEPQAASLEDAYFQAIRHAGADLADYIPSLRQFVTRGYR